MNQKRLENEDIKKDVCLRENEKTSQKKMYECLMSCAAPLLTAAFLSGSVCWAAELRYGSKEEFDSNPEAAAVFSPDGIASEADIHIETRMPEENAVSGVIENTGAELVEACGVYVDNKFIGAVVNGEQIQDELKLVLDEYKNDESIIEANYAVEAEIKEGVYRSAALVSDEDMTDYLRGEKEIVTEYTADNGDTPEKVADDFGMTIEEIKKLNPDISKLEEGEAVKIKETVSVLPIRYTCQVTEEEELSYDMLSGSSGNYLSGEKGKRINQYEVTYVDGTEVSRKLTKSETVLEPAAQSESKIPDEEIVSDDEIYTDELYNESIPESDTEFGTGWFMWPVNGGYISDPFMSDRRHKGMDIAADGGTDIYAAAGGIVMEAGWNDGGYGNFVVIDHGNGYVTLYGHASEVYVSSGQIVSAGDLIAAVGTTGDSTGNHCHFEVMYNGGYLDPAAFICG